MKQTWLAPLLSLAVLVGNVSLPAAGSPPVLAQGSGEQAPDPRDTPPGGALEPIAIATPIPTAVAIRPGLADDTSVPTPLPLPTVAPRVLAESTPPPAPPTTLIVVDRPAEGVNLPQRFTATGWAADLDGPGTGVDLVHVYLNGEAGRGIFLGTARYGDERPDVGRLLGHIRYSLSGWSLPVELPPGTQTLYVHARRRGADAWSPPTTVEFSVSAIPVDTGAAIGARGPSAPGSCPRYPDGTCINRPAGTSPTCPVIGPDGQCLSGGAGVNLPGVVGLPLATPVTAQGSGLCVQRDAGGRCLAFANQPQAADAPLVLRADSQSGMSVLQWNSVTGAVTYELLRCSSAAGSACTSLAVVNGTSYQVGRATNTWYVVQARSGNGQVIATSNVAASP